MGKTASKGTAASEGENGALGEKACERENGVPATEEVRGEATVTIPFVGKMKWSDIKVAALLRLSEPMNIALLLWIVAVAGGESCSLMDDGMLNAVIPDKTNRQIWGRPVTRS